MGSKATTTLGILVGLIGFLAMATIGVVAVNGTNNPGITRPGLNGSSEPAAAGSTAPEQGRQSWTPLDLNGDGYVSLAEAAGDARVVIRFNRADRNRDGKLSKAEFDRLDKMPPPKAPKGKSRVTRQKPTADEKSAAAGG
jgi:hypothetical protein